MILLYQVICLFISMGGIYTSFRRLNLVNSETNHLIRLSVIISILSCIYLFLECIQMKLVDPGLAAICLSISLWEFADRRRDMLTKKLN